jgi:hypothetical protein
MDEQFSTWMDWIWSSRCLALLCTSTQSSNLKWVSRGGINSPRHLKSHWLTTTEKGSVGWTDATFSRPSVHQVPLSTPLSRWGSLTQILRRYTRRCVGSFGAEGLLTKTSLLVSSRPSHRPTLPLTKASVHPVLKSLFWRVSVLIQTRHQIDQQCPHLHRRIIRC